MSEFNGVGGQSGGLRQLKSVQEDCKESLHEVIERQIIPRLLNVQQFFSGKAPQAVQNIAQSQVDAQPEFQAFTQQSGLWFMRRGQICNCAARSRQHRGGQWHERPPRCTIL